MPCPNCRLLRSCLEQTKATARRTAQQAKARLDTCERLLAAARDENLELRRQLAISPTTALIRKPIPPHLDHG